MRSAMILELIHAKSSVTPSMIVSDFSQACAGNVYDCPSAAAVETAPRNEPVALCGPPVGDATQENNQRSGIRAARSIFESGCFHFLVLTRASTATVVPT
jgi:hypothetical protein